MEFEKVLSHFTRAQMYLIKWPFVLNILASNFIQYTGVPKKLVIVYLIKWPHLYLMLWSEVYVVKCPAIFKRHTDVPKVLQLF